MISLQSNNQSVRVDEGELISYKVDGHEYIHQKGSPGWSSADTEMFPIIGPVNEADYAVQVPKGTAVQDQHGHLRQFAYESISSSKTTAVFKKKYTAGRLIKNSKFPDKSPKQWLRWPYGFEFEKRYELKREGLEIEFVVLGERDMPFMLGYHPAFKLYTKNPIIKTNKGEITLDEVLAVGSRAFQVADCTEITLLDKNKITIKTEGFGHFMCWTAVRNMVCIEPISFYPYAVAQQNLHEGFEFLTSNPNIFKVKLSV
jgi:galactose mutarotase-like enzyme